MRYWIKHNEGRGLIGRSRGEMFKYQFRNKGAQPLTAYECVQTMKNKHWAGKVVRAKRLQA